MSGDTGTDARQNMRLETVTQPIFTQAGRELLGNFWEDEQAGYESFWLGDASPQRAQGDLFLLLGIGERGLRARLAIYRPHSGAAIFFLYARDANSAPPEILPFLDNVKVFCRNMNVTELTGPMQFSTWHPYRFVSKMGAADFFPGEQKLPEAYHADFLAAGFADLGEYQSNYVPDLAESITTGLAMGVDKSLPAMDIQTFEGGELSRMLPELYRVSGEIFKGNFAYQSIAWDDFLKLSSGGKSHDAVLILASAGGKAAGFSYSYGIGNYSPGIGRLAQPTAVLKTMGVVRQFRGTGLGYGVCYLAHKYWLERSHTGMIHAYMKSDNFSRSMSGRFGEILRTYALMKGNF